MIASARGVVLFRYASEHQNSISTTDQTTAHQSGQTASKNDIKCVYYRRLFSWPTPILTVLLETCLVNVAGLNKCVELCVEVIKKSNNFQRSGYCRNGSEPDDVAKRDCHLVESFGRYWNSNKQGLSNGSKRLPIWNNTTPIWAKGLFPLESQSKYRLRCSIRYRSVYQLSILVKYKWINISAIVRNMINSYQTIKNSNWL